MQSEWSWIRLGDHCQKIGSGATPKGGKESYLDNGPYTLIRSQNVYNTGFSPTGLAFITEEQAQKLSNVTVSKGDVLLNITGDSVARACLVPDDILSARVNQHVAIIRPNPDLFDSRFIRYFLVSPFQQHVMLGLAASGATRNALTKLMIEDFKIPCPSLREQQRIAETLSAIDDIIELNNKTNSTLESIAHTLFKSWFIDFDPVRAKMAGRQPEAMDEATAALFPPKLVDSEIGLIPKGWNVKRMSDLMELAYGKALKATNRIPGDIPVYGSGGIIGYHNEHLVEGPSIIVGRKGTVGSLYWEDRSFFPIDTVFYVKPQSVPLTFCYELLKTQGLNHMNTDAAVPGLNRENVYRLEVVIPPDAILQVFDSIVSSLREMIFSNKNEIQRLTDIRDALLPKLMSGQIRIPDSQTHLIQELTP